MPLVLSDLGKRLALMAAYAAGHWLWLQAGNVVWHPPSGWRFAVLALLPLRWWPWPLAGELLVFLATHDMGGGRAAVVLPALAMFAAHRAFAAVGPAWLRRDAGAQHGDRPDMLARWMLAMLASAFAATLVTSWWLPPMLTGAEAALARPLLFLQLLLGDYIGMLVIVPPALMLVWHRPSARVRARWRRDVPAVLLPSLIAYAALVHLVAQPVYFFATMLCLPPVIYFAYRTGWRGVAIALPAASIAVAASAATVEPSGDAPAQLQLLLALTGSACLLLGAAIDALRAGRDALSRQNAQLRAANRRLDTAGAALRDAARRNLQLAERTRRWITAELHDELGQRLTALQVQLRIAQRTGDGPARLAAVADAVDGVRGALSQLMNELRPADLDRFGLSASLERGAVRELLEAGGVELRLRIDDAHRLLDGLDADLQLALFRIVQEAASNTVRHAGARRFTVRLRARPGPGGRRVVLAIADDGCGLRASSGAGVGLQGIADRVLSLGGRLRLRACARGTRLQVRFSGA